jgi:hypothetical protein
VPIATVPWEEIIEMKSGNWVQWITMKHKITLRSHRGKEKTLDKMKVFLAGGIGRFDWYLDWYDWKHGKIN